MPVKQRPPEQFVSVRAAAVCHLKPNRACRFSRAKNIREIHGRKLKPREARQRLSEGTAFAAEPRRASPHKMCIRDSDTGADSRLGYSVLPHPQRRLPHCPYRRRPHGCESRRSARRTPPRPWEALSARRPPVRPAASGKTTPVRKGRGKRRFPAQSPAPAGCAAKYRQSP